MLLFSIPGTDRTFQQKNPLTHLELESLGVLPQMNNQEV